MSMVGLLPLLLIALLKVIRDMRQVLAFYVVNYSMHALLEISLIIYLVCYILLILM